MSFPAFLDTNVLYGYHLTDLLLRLAEYETFRPLWSDDVLRELERTLVAHAGLDEARARHRIAQMRLNFPDAEVDGYAALVQAMNCAEHDRHVLAAAVRADAAALVTFNVTDFPRSSTDPYDIRVVHPDVFLLDQLDLYPRPTALALHEMINSYQDPPVERAHLLASLARAGVPDFAAAAHDLAP